MSGAADRLSAALADRYRIERELGQAGWRPITPLLSRQQFFQREMRLDRDLRFVEIPGHDA